MASSEYIPEQVHLVGSVNLPTVDDVFNNIGKILGDRAPRVPDGEPGSRRGWISYQYPLLRVHPDLEYDPNAQSQHPGALPMLRLRQGVDPNSLKFTELGYAREAFVSYRQFRDARKAGRLPARSRFQVSLPTPAGVIHAYIRFDQQHLVEPAYEAAILAELARIVKTIPHKDLAIQWDVCREMVVYDGRLFHSEWQDPEREIVARLARISRPVPADVELGFHLCYGDLNKRHFIDPVDLGKAVGLANAISRAVARPIAFMHVPVPMARSDDDYFRPLADLKLHPETRLFLGLVHLQDGAEGTRKRIAAAAKYATRFGVATECGIGRSYRTAEVPELLRIHAAVTKKPAGVARARTLAQRRKR